MLNVRVRHGTELVFEDPAGTTRLVVTFMRTLRVPDDGSCYPLPAGMGPFPIRDVARYAGRVPPAWLSQPGVMVPMYSREALWIALESEHRHPNAIKVGAGYINAVSGKRWNRALAAPLRPSLLGKLLGEKPAQDYLVCPPQHWFDGFHTGYGTVRQFVAVPLGEGKTVEAQLTGKEEHGGIQLLVYQPKPGRFPQPVLPPDPTAGTDRVGTPALPQAAGPAGPPLKPEDRAHLDQLATVPMADRGPALPPLVAGYGPTTSPYQAAQQTMRGWPAPAAPPGPVQPQTAPAMAPPAMAPQAPPAMVPPAPPAMAPQAPPAPSPMAPAPMAPAPMPAPGSAPLPYGVPGAGPASPRSMPAPGPFSYGPPPGGAVSLGPPSTLGAQSTPDARGPFPSVEMGPVAGAVPTQTAQGTAPAHAAERSLGLAMSGQLMQKIYADPYGIDTWDERNCGEILVHIVSAESFFRITGEQPPPTPISRASYDAAGFGWVAAYDDDLAAIDPGGDLRRVKPLSAWDKDR